MIKVDYIIVGQGICGTFLSYYLLKENKSVFVIDDNKKNSASRVASGVINPVTGRRIVKTWKIDELMPFAWNAYNEMGEKLAAENIISEIATLDIHATMQMQKAFRKKLRDGEHNYIYTCEHENDWKNYFNFEFGIDEIKPTYLINLKKLLSEWRNYLMNNNSISDEFFEIDLLQLKDDFVQYKNVSAHRIIFCDGVASARNNFFEQLPFAFNKGEALIVSIPDLPRNFIYKLGYTIVPYEENLFWIGSTYEWNFSNDLPSEEFKNDVELFLIGHLKLPYEIKNHFASIRPANTERRPFVGLHNIHPQVGILNGMGTKGCSLAPFYANQLCDHLLYDKPINAEADVKRFLK